MVAKLIRSSHAWSLVVFGLIGLGVVIGVSHWSNPPHGPVVVAQGPPPGPTGTGSLLPAATGLSCIHGNPFWHCVNFPHGYPVGTDCQDPSCAGGTCTFSTRSGTHRPGTPADVVSANNSIIEHASFNYIHFATDYNSSAGAGGGAGGGRSGCGSCASGSPGGGLLSSGQDGRWTSLVLRRYYRSRDLSHESSFGPGHFSSFDLKLHLFHTNFGTGSSTRVDVVDPALLSPLRLEPSGNVFKDPQLQSIGELRVSDAQGNLITNLGGSSMPGVPSPPPPVPVSAELFTLSGEKFVFQVINTGMNYVGTDYVFQQPGSGSSNVLYDARLTRVQDRNGYGLTIAYKTWTPAELTESPDRQWQIDQITSDHGQTATFQYLPTQVGGRWAVSQINLPGGQSLTYSYANNQLASVSHPDGSVSTFAYAVENCNCPQAGNEHAAANTIVVSDPAADAGHQFKKVYLTLDYNYPGQDDYILSQSSNLVRMVVNSSNEVTYWNHPLQDYGLLVYEGAGQAKIVNRSASQYYKDGWEFVWQPDATGQLHLQVSGTLEPWTQYGGGESNALRGTPATSTDSLGITKSYEYDSDGTLTKTTYADNTFETWCYNEFKQVTRHRDRLGRVTKSTSDARGNVLLKEVGLTDSSANTPANGYNPCAADDVQTAEYAASQWEYYPTGNANQFLMSASIDANGNRTDYAYDANHRLLTVTQPPDISGSARAVTQLAYDAAGRLHTVTDPESHVAEYFYDSRNRVTQVLYEDGTTDRHFYGTGATANLLVKSVDRRNVVTNYEYDLSGRRTRTITAAAVMNLAGTEGPVSDPSVTVEEICQYLPGTNLRTQCVSAGDKTSYKYDYRHRLVETSVYPNANKVLTSKQTYVANQLFKTEDPYGRKQYFAYDATDGRLVRQIQATVPSVSYANFTAVLNKVRDPDGTPNSTSIIADYLYDAEGQTTSTIDGRGIEHRTIYDSRGRTTEQIQAFGTAVAAKSQTIYDANSNVLETRSPRYFDANDAQGFSKCRTTMTYTGRNRLKTRTEAPGTPIAATESFAYDLGGDQTSHIDFRGHQWQTLHPDCCGRVRLTIDPLGHGTITHADPLGNVTHTAAVADVLSHTNHLDPINAKTYREVTTRYDERGRVIASTTWLVTRGVIDPTNPPIAGDNGVAAADGLTSRSQYDEHLTDNSGLNQQFSQHLTGLVLGPDIDGSARLVTNPAGERALAISDGVHRSFRAVQLDANGAALTSNTQTYDALVTVANYGDVLETSSANALGHTNRSRSDGAGRSIQSVDAANFVTNVKSDANGNRLSVRDPNNVGQDCVFDALNRDNQCADTQELLDNVNRRKSFNLAGQVVQEIDAKNKTTSHVYDARGRKATTTDRINATTVWSYDAVSNETSMTDAENQTTSYGYDALNRRITIQWPDHVAGTNPGDQHYGIQATAYDPASRATVKTAQNGDTITLVYDLAARMLRREYRTQANSPSGAIADQDTFTYDAVGRMLTAIKGRYANTVTFTYADGRKATETLTIFGQTYAVGYGYDAAGKENTLTYPDGTVVNRGYTNRGQLAAVNLTPTGGAATSVATFVYDAGRRESSRTLGNGLVTSRSYQADNQVTLIATPNVESLAYTYDANKNPTAEVRASVMVAYSWSTGATGFDNQNRLTGWSRQNGDAQSWQLTPVNDWQQFTNNGVQQTRTHGPAHEITAVGSTPLVHDNRGNLTQDERGTLMTYDADNMLSAFNANNVTGLKDATYQYDALGRRVAKTVAETGGDVTKVYVLASQQVVAEYISLAAQPLALARAYIYGTYIDEPLALLSSLNSGLSTTYFHANRQFSIYALTDSTGSIVEFYAYSPHGAHRCFDPMGADQGTTPQRGHVTLFTGRTVDVESQLNYFRERYLDIKVGRFTSRDPLKYPDGPNAYAGWFIPSRRDPFGSQSAGDYEDPPYRPQPPIPWWNDFSEGWNVDSVLNPANYPDRYDDGTGTNSYFWFPFPCGQATFSFDVVATGPVVDDSFFATAATILNFANSAIRNDPVTGLPRLPINQSVSVNCPTGMRCCPLKRIESNIKVITRVTKTESMVWAGVDFGTITVTLTLTATAISNLKLGICVPDRCPCPRESAPVVINRTIDLTQFTFDL